MRNKESLKGPELLRQYDNNWETEMGAWFPGERVVLRGKDFFSEIAEMSWMEMLVFTITGKRLAKNQNELLEKLWILSTSYPEPRLWNNRVAALAGTTKNTGALAISSAIACSEATVFGYRPNIKALDLLERATIVKQTGIGLEKFILNELITHKSLPGFGRPITKIDERIKPVLRMAKKLDCDRGNLLALTYEIEEILRNTRYRLTKNIASIAGALVGDMGLSSREFYLLSILDFTGGFFASFIDASVKPEGCFFPIMCQDIVNKNETLYRQWEKL